MPKYSIVVPVYNTEKFLRKCLESIKNQTFTDFQVILVDDCSTDSSNKICREFCENDNRFSLVKTDVNVGLSAVRNTGLKYVKGDYVTFIDSDDYVELNMLEEIDNNLGVQEYDFVEWGMYYDVLLNSGEISIKESPLNSKETKKITNATVYDLNDFILNTFFASSCNKLYKTKVINQYNLEFDTECVDFEDFIFNINYMNYVNKFMILKNIFYHYYIPENQIAPLKRKWGKVERFYVSDKVFDSVEKFLNKVNDNKFMLTNIMFYAYKSYNNEIEYLYRTNNWKDFRVNIYKLIHNKKYYKMLGYINSGNLKKVILPIKFMIKFKMKFSLAIFMWLITKRNIK